MYLVNKYTAIYYKIIERAKQRNHIKQLNDGYQRHHIIPRCIGGTNDLDNLVVLSYKEHRVCHCLLIKMQTTKNSEIKMRHAYGFFNKSSRYNGPRYKTGKDNIFSTPEIIEQVSKRMSENNPMCCPAQKLRMRLANSNPYVRTVTVDGKLFTTLAEACRYFDVSLFILRKNFIIHYTENKNINPRNIAFCDKFITPYGTFKTKKEIQKILKIPEWTLNTIYNNLDARPVINGRASKKIDHLNINPNITWRDNGFSLVAVS